MGSLRHVIIGGGMAGHAAAAAIRELDPDAPITLLSADPDGPYARPPLSKGLWLGQREESVRLPPVEDLLLLPGRRAVTIDLQRMEVVDDRRDRHPYERLLLATGGAPRRLPFGEDRIIYFRTLGDYRRLRAVPGPSVVVVGGGFIGSELAASLTQAGRQVTLVFPEQLVCQRVLPRELAREVTALLEDRGVTLLPGRTVTGVAEWGSSLLVQTSDGAQRLAEAVVAGLGILPETGLARAAGLTCGDGVEVDAELRTSAAGVFAAGDVASFPCAALGGRLRFEHEDAAVTMGRAAGRNMAGAREPYLHLPFFYSDLFDVGYEAVGRLDARMETVASWKVPRREGFVCYLEGDRVRGVLLWGLSGQVEAARRLIRGDVPLRRDRPSDALHA